MMNELFIHKKRKKIKYPYTYKSRKYIEHKG